MSRNTIKKSNTIRNPHAIQAQSTKSGRNACTKQPGNIEPGEGPIGPIPSARIVPGPRSSGHCSNPTSQILRPLSAVDRHTIQPIQTNPAFTVQLIPAASLPLLYPHPAVIHEQQELAPPQFLQSCQSYCHLQSHCNQGAITESHRNWRTERPGYIEPGRPVGRLARPLQSDCRIALGRQSEHLMPPHPDNRSLQSCQPYCNPESHLNSIAIAESHRNWCTEQPGYIEPGQPVGRLVRPLRRDCRIAL